MVLNEKLIHQIEEDIKLCDNQLSSKGSQALYNELIARYTVLDSDFKNGLPSMGKAKWGEYEYDFRPELRAISSKLQMVLLSEEKGKEESQMLDDELRETQTANYFSDVYPIDCTVSPANALFCRKNGTLLQAGNLL